LGTGRDGADDPNRQASVATVKNQPAGREESAEGGGEPGGDGQSGRNDGQSDPKPTGEPSSGRSPRDRPGQGGKPKVGQEDSAGNQGSETGRSRQDGSASGDEETSTPDGDAKKDPNGIEGDGQPRRSDQQEEAPGDRAGDRTDDDSPQRKQRPGAEKSSPGGDSEPDSGESREASRQSSQASTPSRRPLPSPSEMLNTALANIPQAIKWLYYLLFFAIVAFLVWKYRVQVLAAIRGFIDAIRDFWADLLGRRDTGEQTEDELAAAASLPPPPPFSTFANPFLTGEARRLAPHELVVYSFRALEAWGREHDCPRMEDQTPHEFANRLGFAFTEVGREATILADLYCAAAYSPQPLTTTSVSQLERLWSSFAECPGP